MKKLFASLGLMLALLSPGLTLAEEPVVPVQEAVVAETAAAEAGAVVGAEVAVAAEAAAAEKK